MTNDNFPDFNYFRFPALATYIDRVGARQVNFKKFVIWETDERSGYARDKVNIKIVKNKDGSIEVKCDREEFLPTVEEVEAIKAALAGVEFPASMRTGKAGAEELGTSGKITGQLYVFYDVSRKEVIMCQERREKKDGTGKYFVPWTMFMTKGGSPRWCELEPDGLLPFWKPPKKRERAYVMVHEGAKAAEYCDRLVNDPEMRDELKKHPWGEELTRYEHWGASGGALGTHRCDFEELKNYKIEGNVVYYVCDHDAAGEEAVKTFSRLWGKTLIAIKFDNDFRAGWDLADKLPEVLINKVGTAKKRLRDFSKPATWATVAVSKQAFALSSYFSEEWYHSVKPLRFHHARLPLRSFTAEEFDVLVRPVSDVEKTSRLVVKSAHSKALSEMYHPGKEPGLCTDEDGGSFINTYIPSAVRSYADDELRVLKRQEPDYTAPFERFLEVLVPSPGDRHHIAKAAATLMSGSLVKLPYGLLMVSETQGVGKTTLCDIVGMVVGKKNTVSIQASNIVEGGFTEWGEKHVIIINEILEGHSPKVYDKTKEFITGDTIYVNKKYQPPYTAINFTNFFACSNSKRALTLPNEDRRWLIVEVTDLRQPKEFWVEFYDWLENREGYRKVKQWAKDYVAKHGAVTKGDTAPRTKAKEEMIFESYSYGTKFIYQPLDWVASTHRANCGIERVSSDQFRFDGETIRIHDHHKLKLKVIEYAKAGVEIIMIDQHGVEAIKTFNEGKPPHKWQAAEICKLADTLGLYVSKRITARGWVSGYHARVISTSRELAEMGNDLARAASMAKGEGPFEVTLSDGRTVQVVVVNLAMLADEFQLV